MANYNTPRPQTNTSTTPGSVNVSKPGSNPQKPFTNVAKKKGGKRGEKNCGDNCQ